MLPASAFELRICGSGDPNYIRELKELATELGIDSITSFTGSVDDNQKAETFYNSDILVLPSHSENFGMVVAESLAFGVPAIASSSTPWHQLSTIGCGLCVDNSPQSLSTALVEIKNGDLPGMGRKGRDWMLRDFSWSARAQELHRLYCELVSTVDK